MPDKWVPSLLGREGRRKTAFGAELANIGVATPEQLRLEVLA